MDPKPPLILPYSVETAGGLVRTNLYIDKRRAYSTQFAFLIPGR